MTKDETIDRLWENSGHDTRREDIEAAYNAGVAADRMEVMRSLLCRVLQADDYFGPVNLPDDLAAEIRVALDQVS